MADPQKKGFKVTDYNPKGRDLYERHPIRYVAGPENADELKNTAWANARRDKRRAQGYFSFNGELVHPGQLISKGVLSEALNGEYDNHYGAENLKSTARDFYNQDLLNNDRQYALTMGHMFNVNSEDARRALGKQTAPELMGTNPGINQDILDDYEAAYDDYNYDLYDANLEFGKRSHPDGNSDSPWRNDNIFMQPGSKPWQRKQTIYQKHYPSQQFRLGGFIKKRF